MRLPQKVTNKFKLWIKLQNGNSKELSLRLPSRFSQSKFLLNIGNRYTEILIENRYGNVNTQSGNTETTRFCNEFDASYSTPILESCMKIILSKKTNFVGTKTLCGALKVIQIALKCKRTRVVIQNHITTILYELSLPILLIT